MAWNDTLAAVALSHARDMAERGFHGHYSPTSGSPEDRLRAAGVKWKAMGENVVERFVEGLSLEEVSVEEVARGMLSAWLESPGHRKNMLRAEFQETGVGAVVKEGSDGTLRFIAVQVFKGD